MLQSNRSPKSLRRSGMTLVEVLAVVVILGLLAGTLAVGFSGASARAAPVLPGPG